MASYLNQNGNSIGSLLRFIQEQKSQSPIIPPSSEASSPIRGVIQGPLKSPEDTGTSKVVSIRPEGNVAALGEGQPIVGQTESMGPASSIAQDIGRNIASPNQMTPNGPIVNQSVVSPSLKQSVSAPSIQPSLGTRISSNMPTTSKVGGIILEPKTTQVVSGKTTQTGPVYKQTGSPVPYPTTGPTPTPPRYTPPVQQQQPKAQAPSLATIIGGGAWQGLKKLFGW